ncbi:hypothetical protein OQA88_8893 [Cercophora sp. LCS_1]
MRIGDSSPPPTLNDFSSLSSRTADPPLPIPSSLPAQTPKSSQPRFAESSVYPYLETNVHHLPMEFTQEPFPTTKSALSTSIHGPDTPFRHWSVINSYITSLVTRNGYEDLINYNTTVENATKTAGQWVLTLRKDGKQQDYWWTETFDAVIVASGHYSVPYIPAIPGLEQFEKSRPGAVIHSKQYRGRDYYRNKRVVVVGASVSAADIAFDLASNGITDKVHAITVGHAANGYFGAGAFEHPVIKNHPSIERVEGRTIQLVDGGRIEDVDNIIFGTGYSWTLPFLPQVEVRNNRVPGLYQHVIYRGDPTLLFVGAVAAGLTFKIFEWQAVLAARILAGRANLPGFEEMKKWEDARIKKRGDGVKFTLVFPDFEEYFEEVRRLAGDEGPGRKLPPFKREWFRAFLDGHDMRKAMWRRLNAEAATGKVKARL